MLRSKLPVAVFAILILTTILRAQPNSDTVTVTGAVEKPGDWTVARVKTDLAADVTPITYTSHGQKHTADAVPLLALLKASGVPTQYVMNPHADPKTKNLQLRLALLVQATDGYAVVFSLAELLPDFGNRKVWLAIDADGQPLSPTDGPMRLLVPEDAKPSRAVHAVQTITVVNLSTPPSTQPTN